MEARLIVFFICRFDIRILLCKILRQKYCIEGFGGNINLHCFIIERHYLHIGKKIMNVKMVTFTNPSFPQVGYSCYYCVLLILKEDQASTQYFCRILLLP